MKPRALFLAVLSAAILAGGARGVEVSGRTVPPHKATADQLLADAENSVAVLARIAQPVKGEKADPTLKLDDPRQQPFWGATRKMAEKIKDIRAKLKAKDFKFFDALNDTTQQMAVLRSAYSRSGISNIPIQKTIRALGNALTLLRLNYGREARALPHGGVLTLDERQDFERLKAQEQALLDQLKALQLQVDMSAHLKSDLGRLIARLSKSLDAPPTADAFRAALENIDVVEGEWEGMSYFVEPKFREAWTAAGTADTFSAMDKIQTQATASNSMSFDDLDSPVEADVETRTDNDMTDAEAEEYEAWLEDTVINLELAAYYEAVHGEFGEMSEEEMQT